jgi:hypothetical protein
MMYISLILGALVGIITLAISNLYSKNLTLTTFLTVFAIVAACSLSKMYLATYVEAETYEYFLLREDGVCRLIAERYPNEFKAYIKNIKQIIRANEGKDSLVIYKITLLDAIVKLTVSKATNEAIYDFFKSELNLYKDLYSLDPSLVLYMEFPDQYKKKLNPSLAILLSGEGNVTQVISGEEEVIKSGLLTPQPPLNETQKAQATAQLQTIFQKLAQVYDESMLTQLTTNASDPKLNKRDAALYIISFYQAILDLGWEDAGNILRTFYKGDESGNKT